MARLAVASMLVMAFVVAAMVVLYAPGSQGLTPAQRIVALDTHNAHRAKLGLRLLTYSTSIEDFSQDYAARCPSGHSSGSGYGENLYWSSRTDSETRMAAAINSWHSEVDVWNCQDNTCEPGEMCGHFTAIMWNSTSTVGCGMVNNCPGTFKTAVVCNYSPPGNVVSSGNKLRPYPITLCSGYPFFNNTNFALSVTLNTTSTPYNEATFKQSMSTLLGLRDTNRVYIISSASPGADTTVVKLFIVTAGSSDGHERAEEFINLVNTNSPQLATRNIFATTAAFSTNDPPADDSGSGRTTAGLGISFLLSVATLVLLA